METTNVLQTQIKEFQNIYSPSTILGVYSNLIRTQVDGKVILARGIYQYSQNQKEYGGYFYDSISSPNDNKSVRTKTPKLLRTKLEDNTTYIFKGYIEKKISFSSIELIFVIDEILEREETQISEEEILRYKLLQNKIAKGFKDLEATVKEHVYNNTTLKIANIYGSTAIVHKDFEKGIGNAVVNFQISTHRCNFASKTELITTIRKLKTLDYDVIAFVRGGGDKASFEVFNDSELCSEAIAINQILVTALGHAINESFLDKIADKKFALPHDYGNTLKVWVDQATEEQTKSKSLFIDQVKKDLAKTYTEQITTLTTQLTAKNKENEAAQQKFKEILEQSQKDKTDTIQAKEKAFQSGIQSLNEQLKAKEENLKIIQSSIESNTKHQIASATADLKARYELATSQTENLTQQLQSANQIKNRIIIFVILAAAFGVVVGLLF